MPNISWTTQNTNEYDTYSFGTIFSTASKIYSLNIPLNSDAVSIIANLPQEAVRAEWIDYPILNVNVSVNGVSLYNQDTQLTPSSTYPTDTNIVSLNIPMNITIEPSDTDRLLNFIINFNLSSGQYKYWTPNQDGTQTEHTKSYTAYLKRVEVPQATTGSTISSGTSLIGGGVNITSSLYWLKSSGLQFNYDSLFVYNSYSGQSWNGCDLQGNDLGYTTKSISTLTLTNNDFSVYNFWDWKRHTEPNIKGVVTNYPINSAVWKISNKDETYTYGGTTMRKNLGYPWIFGYVMYASVYNGVLYVKNEIDGWKNTFPLINTEENNVKQWKAISHIIIFN